MMNSNLFFLKLILTSTIHLDKVISTKKKPKFNDFEFIIKLMSKLNNGIQSKKKEQLYASILLFK